MNDAHPIQIEAFAIQFVCFGKKKINVQNFV